MRLLLVTKDFPPDVGGIQTYCAEIAQRFVGRCESFAVVAPRVAGYEATDAALPFDVVRIPGSRSSFAPAVLAHLSRLKGRFRFNVVLGAQWQSAWAAVAGRHLLGPYAVCAAVHGREVLTMHYAHLGASALYDRARRYTMGAVDRLFPGSNYALQLVREKAIAYRSAEVVNYGCNIERFEPRGGAEKRRELGLEGRQVLLTLSRLVPRKGIDTVLEALPAIASAVPGVQYIIAGGGPDRSRLEQLAERLGVTARVRFLGLVPDETITPLLSMADLFVMPAREERPDVEGFGLVFLEANACGTAVIGSTSGGISDAVVDGQTGLLVPPGAPGPLADATIRLLNDSELRHRLGQAGRARVLRDFTWERMAVQLSASMSELISAP
ncbi:MAG: glycosyltransferase family 4 protein [Gemmatimonadota bacterium]